MTTATPFLPKDSFRSARRGYHHGRLREALLEASQTLLAQRGVGAFTLAEAAKLVGVTPAAPYRHFTDRNALLIELARRGFELFADRLESAWNDGNPDPLAAFRRAGPAYLAFARDEPGLYAAMFDKFIAAEEGTGEPCPHAQRALACLHNMAGSAIRHIGGDESRTHEVALQIWSFSHGVSTLGNSGHLNDPEQVLSSGALSLIAATRSPERAGLVI